MNVCDSLVATLAEQGVEYIFGIPGDAINELLEAIRKQDKIKFIHVMHEETGAFAAAAQAKLSGKLAVCVGTAGPGAIHLLNGLYDAKKDHAPVLAITGQTNTGLLGTNSHQEINLVRLFEDVSVYNQQFVDPDQVPGVIMAACQSALAMKGVAHVNIPVNVADMKVKTRDPGKLPGTDDYSLVPHESHLQEAARLIGKASRIAILSGIGARNAAAELLEFAERLNAPVIKALRGKDVIPDMHPQTLGGIGLLGTTPSYKAMKECDLLIVVGSDMPYGEFYPDPEIPVIQIDNDPRRIGRRHITKIPLAGDAKKTLLALLALVAARTDDSFLADCRAEKERWIRKQEEKELSEELPLHPQALARAVSDQAAGNAVVCCDTGTVTVWGARHFRIREQQLFTLSGGLASMAFGLPAAIGAQLLYPGRQVIALCGDGGFAMLMCDFATAVRYCLPVKIIVFNNAKLGLIKIEEEARSGNPEYETGLHNPDYAAFAVACGGEGYTVKTAQELKTALPQAMASPKACIVNVFVDPDELTIPPKISLAEAFNYVKAKVKEAFE